MCPRSVRRSHIAPFPRRHLGRRVGRDFFAAHSVDMLYARSRFAGCEPREREPFAGVAELVDALDLGSSDESRGGSSPSARTSDIAIGQGQSRAARRYTNFGTRPMQVTQTLAEGLKREFKVVVPGGGPRRRGPMRSLTSMKDKVRINGFRPGKVPVAHLKRLYGRSVMAETSRPWSARPTRRSSTTTSIKLAMEPKLDFEAATTGSSRCWKARRTSPRRFRVEVLPNIDLGDSPASRSRSRSRRSTDAEVRSALERSRTPQRPYSRQEGRRKAAEERPRADRLHRHDRRRGIRGRHGRRTSRSSRLELFIPGFEDQLIGVKAGEKQDHRRSPFPAIISPSTSPARPRASMYGEVDEAPGELTIDDELAKSARHRVASTSSRTPSAASHRRASTARRRAAR